MSSTDVIQAITFATSLIAIPVWFVIGLKNRRLIYLRWVVLIPCLLTSLFYSVVFVTDWNETNPAQAIFISALIRLYIMALFLVGGIVMLRTKRTS